MALAAFSATLVLAQRPARIGPDGKPLLNRPVLEECQKRKQSIFYIFKFQNLIVCDTYKTR